MKYAVIPSSQSVVHHCKARGIKNIIISPGSRNAPLTIGFTGDPFFKCFSIVDERCAAFFALGMAQQLREPTVLVCTSGSALLNYFPAVAEAFYSDVPLVVISADRPGYKVDIGDGQTIRQENVFGNHVGYGANLRLDVAHATDKVRKYDPTSLSGGSLMEVQAAVQRFNDAELDKALNMAFFKSVPVHINVPFEEPLYGMVEGPTVVPSVRFVGEQAQGLDPASFGQYARMWNSADRKIVLVGVNFPGTIEQRYLEMLATDPSVIVLTESTSNLYHPNFFPSIDSIIAPIEKSQDRAYLFQELRPTILLTFGGLVVSKKVKAFLREYTPRFHWHIDDHKALDTFFSLTDYFKVRPNIFFGQLIQHYVPKESGYREYWSGIKDRYTGKRKAYLGNIPFSDMLAFYHVMCSIPNDYQLQLGNSSTVRYAQLFDIPPSVTVFCNRGTSGIDGSTSTAVGAAYYATEPTLLVTGDLSFLYDSNGLWNSYIRPDFRIIIINNGGGGIFRILPGKEETENFETFFETTQQLDLGLLAGVYNFEFRKASEAQGLREALDDFFRDSHRPKILEIETPRLLNDKVLLSYFDFIS